MNSFTQNDFDNFQGISGKIFKRSKNIIKFYLSVKYFSDVYSVPFHLTLKKDVIVMRFLKKFFF